MTDIGINVEDKALTIGDGGHSVLPNPRGHRAHAGVAGLSLERVGAGRGGRAAALCEQL